VDQRPERPRHSCERDQPRLDRDAGTRGFVGVTTDEQEQGLYKHLSGDIPLGRLGKPDDIAKAVVFLSSDDASFVTGIELFVDGVVVQV
jgi:NAD(P)-dependent dehydrogenase (short-subunit alcohol dehydrogenase family)